MTWQNTPARYGTLSIAMHWLMALLIVALYACIELHEAYPKGSDTRAALKTWHFMLGLSVFFLVWLRLLLRVLQVQPAIEPPPVAWQRFLAGLVHVALYVFMIGMPLAGWVVLSGEGKPVPFFGLELPALIAQNKETAERVEEIHKTVGTIGYALVGVHAVAALFHHYVLRDNTLTRMLAQR